MNQNPFPVLGLQFEKEEYCKIDLSVLNIDSGQLRDMKSLESYIREYLRKNRAKVAYGGYLEERSFYLQSDIFYSSVSPRTIHLGIDLWTEPFIGVYCPVDGTLESFQYNGGFLDYGYTLIIRHELDDAHFFTLYGHLDKSIPFLPVKGTTLQRGERIAETGNFELNGGWPPHLHFQIVKNLSDFVGDYPGVCSRSNLNEYKINCPDPASFVLPGD